MDFGYTTPTRPPLGTAENTIALVEKAEEIGLKSVAVPDHVLPPWDFDNYPYTESGRMPWGASADVLEMMTLVAFLAGHTRSIRIATGVMVVPLRNPLLTAKMIATADVLSGGRIIVGCGVGWEEKEFVALGAPPFAERGRATDDAIRLFKEVWTAERPAFASRYATIADMPFLPKPVQKPHPPIWIGGESAPAMRRAAALGDVWYPIGSNQKRPLDTPARYGAAVTEVRRLAAAHGRNPGALGFAYSALWYNEGPAVAASNGERRAFTGTFADAIDDVRRFEDAGCGHIVLNLQASSLETTLARMDRFADRVMAKLAPA